MWLLLFRPGPSLNLKAGDLMYQVQQPVAKPKHPFALTVSRKPSLEPIFDTRGYT